MKDINYIVLDLETGGFDVSVANITEIAFIVLNKKFEIIEEFTQLIKPYIVKNDIFVQQDAYNQQALQITGLTIEQLTEEGIDIKKALKMVNDSFIKNKIGRTYPILVGHNITFDIKFLQLAFKQFLNQEFLNSQIIDTLSLAYLFDLDFDSYSLDTLNEKLKINLTQSHRALNDCHTTRKLLIKYHQSIKGEVKPMIEGKEEIEVKKDFYFQF